MPEVTASNFLLSGIIPQFKWEYSVVSLNNPRKNVKPVKPFPDIVKLDRSFC